MNKLVYIFVPNEFVIDQVVFKLLIKMLAVAMVNKTVVSVADRSICNSPFTRYNMSARSNDRQRWS
jgi:hypothetical protein